MSLGVINITDLCNLTHFRSPSATAATRSIFLPSPLAAASSLSSSAFSVSAPPFPFRDRLLSFVIRNRMVAARAAGRSSAELFAGESEWSVPRDDY